MSPTTLLHHHQALVQLGRRLAQARIQPVRCAGAGQFECSAWMAQKVAPRFAIGRLAPQVDEQRRFLLTQFLPTTHCHQLLLVARRQRRQSPDPGPRKPPLPPSGGLAISVLTPWSRPTASLQRVPHALRAGHPFAGGVAHGHRGHADRRTAQIPGDLELSVMSATFEQWVARTEGCSYLRFVMEAPRPVVGGRAPNRAGSQLFDAGGRPSPARRRRRAAAPVPTELRPPRHDPLRDHGGRGELRRREQGDRRGGRRARRLQPVPARRGSGHLPGAGAA